MYRWVCFVLILVSCSPKQKDKIITPSLDSDFYVRSIAQIESEIENNPEDARLIKLQLSYYEKLNWPEEAERPIERAKVLLGLDPTFISQQIGFYQVNERRKSLLDLIDELERMGEVSPELKRTKLEIRMALATDNQLIDDLQNFQPDSTVQDYLLMARGYLSIGDTVGALQFLFPAPEMGLLTMDQVSDFIPALSNLDDVQGGITFLVSVAEQTRLTRSGNRLLAQLYYQLGDTAIAKSTLLGDMDREEYLIASQWYRNEKKWDSASLYINKLLQADSTDSEALMIAGDLFQDRGFFRTSLTFYNKLLTIDSTDQTVLEQVELVNRKIAYLQKIRNSQRDIPMLQLDSKKSDRN